ncbi:hypothetical protein JOD43_001413 [Pullulanibacillus pueri]|uniref:Uncharacterized protein n=1 Tax=Pullulanibacillus pueri TaxID=1437324 RepID=A0A8J2ZTL4_9BACL|nr:hypothetical protein [Pullulanibacillus pueri]MBM7681246.1 hypothetical protein [Pullulanibacillus pueri]GGH77895.1 hypothetical protein GCM10007096_10470 [Pullulanibacillus pueri]
MYSHNPNYPFQSEQRMAPKPYIQSNKHNLQYAHTDYKGQPYPIFSSNEGAGKAAPHSRSYPSEYHMPSQDIYSRLNHISSLLHQVIQQNNQLLQYIHAQDTPEQSQTVSTPGGGTVIVRM